MVVDSFE